MAKRQGEGLEEFTRKKSKNFKNKLKQIEKWLKLGGHPHYQKGCRTSTNIHYLYRKNGISTRKPMKDILTDCRASANSTPVYMFPVEEEVRKNICRVEPIVLVLSMKNYGTRIKSSEGNDT